LRACAGRHDRADTVLRRRARFVAALGYEPFAYRRDEDRFDPYTAQQSQNVFFVPGEVRAAVDRS